MNRWSGLKLFFLTTLVLLSTTATFVDAATSNDLVWSKESPQIRARLDEPISGRTRAYLESNAGDSVRVWVFFTDKRVFSQTEFERASQQVHFSDKVSRRRSKTDLTQVTFADLPTAAEYVTQVQRLGASLRRTSRWLNAVSIEIDRSRLDALAALPFVSEIRPIARFVRPTITVDEVQPPPADKSATETHSLNYGGSAGQLAQVGVPAMHTRGYDGSGVTLAIFDSGFRTSHSSFAPHFAEGRVLAQYDFIFNDEITDNQPGDASDQWDHGTAVWSVAAGHTETAVLGAAYKANFLLAKTEDVRSETQVEEDNFVAALEWADSLGADVVTASLGYSDWYIKADMDGLTAVTTVGVNAAVERGMVVCNSMGNSGPGATSLSAPADAFNILAVGAVTPGGSISDFSSRGPTADGRTKPEICARGEQVFAASADSDLAFDQFAGTSASTPIIAGLVCLLVEAYPNADPTTIRQMVIETGTNAGSPNNSYGWGIARGLAALDWPVGFDADIKVSQAPITVQFSDESNITTSNWLWDFGDGSTSTAQNPSHSFAESGAYTVSLTIDSELGLLTNRREGYILALGDTIMFADDSTLAGTSSVLSINLVNSQPVTEVIFPFNFQGADGIRLDSATLGERTAYFDRNELILIDEIAMVLAYRLTADTGSGNPPLAKGSGEMLKLHFSIDESVPGASTGILDGIPGLLIKSTYLNYFPTLVPGALATVLVQRGDVDYSTEIDVADVIYLVEYQFATGPEPINFESGDIDASGSWDVSDIIFLVEYMFNDGPAPASLP